MVPENNNSNASTLISIWCLVIRYLRAHGWTIIYNNDYFPWTRGLVAERITIEKYFLKSQLIFDDSWLSGISLSRNFQINANSTYYLKFWGYLRTFKFESSTILIQFQTTTLHAWLNAIYTVCCINVYRKYLLNTRLEVY